MAQRDTSVRSGTGAIAMIDALGFKEISRATSTGRLARRLLQLERQARLEGNRLSKRMNLHVPLDIRISFLSDTIVICVLPGNRRVGRRRRPLATRAQQLGLCVVLAAAIVARIAIVAAKRAPRLAYRGVLEVGEFTCSDRFFVGPAVNSAAAQLELAQGALVWLTLAADRALSAVASLFDTSFLHEYSVPLKAIGAIRATVVVPLPPPSVASLRVRTRVANQILSTFGVPTASDVRAKADATAAFLLDALAPAKEKLADRGKR